MRRSLKKHFWFYLYEPEPEARGQNWVPRYNTRMINRESWPVSHSFARLIGSQDEFLAIFNWCETNVGTYKRDWLLFRVGTDPFFTLLFKEEKYLPWLKLKFPGI